MNSKIEKRNKSRIRRKNHVRKKIRRFSSRLRLSVYKSNKHIFVQLIDDNNHKTLLGISTLSKEMKDKGHEKKSKEAANYLGECVGKWAQENSIDKVVFDRGRFTYHGIVAEIAKGARSSGLKF